MNSQYKYKSPTIEVYMVSADYYHPNWGCLFDFFSILVWKIAGMAGNWGRPNVQFTFPSFNYKEKEIYFNSIFRIFITKLEIYSYIVKGKTNKFFIFREAYSAFSSFFQNQ